jgi:hypothetical protein
MVLNPYSFVSPLFLKGLRCFWKEAERTKVPAGNPGGKQKNKRKGALFGN